MKCHPNSTPHLFHPKYRADIDGLRAIAVLSVVGFHAFPGWVRAGFIGVDIFFVISGFLISTIIFSSLENNHFRYVDFYARRIKRIFPSLILVLIASMVFGWFVLFADEYKQLGSHIVAGAGFASNFILLNEAGYFDNSATSKPLLHLWSLAIEEQFYIIWPLLLGLVWRRRWNFMTLTLLIAIISFIINAYVVQTAPITSFYSPLSRGWELMVGGMLAYLSLHKPQHLPRNPDVESTIGSLLIVGTVIFLNIENTSTGWWPLLPTVGAFLLIKAGPSAWLNRKILSNHYLVWIGLISYPLYLWHWPLLSFAKVIESGVPSRPVRFTLVALSFLLAWMTCRFVEKPIRASKRIYVPFTLLAAMLIVGSIGYGVYRQEGLPLRNSIAGYGKNNFNELMRTPAVDDACKKYIPDPSLSFPYCRFENAGGSETVAVIGDSHAHVAFPGVADILRKKEINTLLLANSGCPSLIGATTGNNKMDMQTCENGTMQLLDIVSRKRDIRKVFIFIRGPLYITGRGYEGAEKNVQVKLSSTTGEPSKPSSEIYFDALQKTALKLNSAGKTVFFVLENPESPFMPGVCIGRPLKEKRDCGIDVNLVKERQAEYRKVISEVRGIVMIDTMDAFCPNGKCQMVIGDELLYADPDHLSVAGSRFQADRVLRRFFTF